MDYGSTGILLMSVGFSQLLLNNHKMICLNILFTITIFKYSTACMHGYKFKFKFKTSLLNLITYYVNTAIFNKHKNK